MPESVFVLNPVDRARRKFTLTVLDEDGAPVSLSSIQVLVVPPRMPLTAGGWTTKTVTGNVLDVVYAGSLATPQAGDLGFASLSLAPGGDLYAKEVNGPLERAWLLERVVQQS